MRSAPLFLLFWAIALTPFRVCEAQENKSLFFPEAGLEIQPESPLWTQAKKETLGTLLHYNFKRKPIRDSLNRDIVPNLSVLIEPVPKGISSPQDFARLCVKEVGYRVLQTLPAGSKGVSKTAGLAHYGSYTDSQNITHRIVVWYGIRQGKAVRVIVDTTDTVWSLCETEFARLLKTITFRK